MHEPSERALQPDEKAGAEYGRAAEALARLDTIGGDGLARDLVLLYLEQSAERLHAARAAMSGGDAVALAEVAHALKSGSAQLGATALADACEAVERAADAGDIDAAREWFGIVESRFATFGAWLARHAADGRASDRERGGGVGAVIAVVEDNADNRLLVDAILGDRFAIDEYATGGHALVGMSQRRPDLVLLDVSLPGMDGLEVLARIRREPSLRAVPVVALTAHAMAGDRERYLSAGFDDYIPKPIVDDTILLRVVERFLSHARPDAGRGREDEGER